MRNKDYELLNDLLAETLTTSGRNSCIITSKTALVYCYLCDFYKKEEIECCSYDIKRFFLNNCNLIDIRECLETQEDEDFYHYILRLGGK